MGFKGLGSPKIMETIVGVPRIRTIVLGGLYMGGCQIYGPFLDPYCNTAPSI